MFHLFGFPFFLASVALYFLPTIIGASRHKTNLVGIFLVNFFLGWSIIGWVIALVWAVSTERVDQLAYAPGMPPGPAPQPQMHGRYCPSCGSAAPAGAQFCAQCGQRMG
jgi:Superinfection immunity protein/zinc-ribbon domain